MTRATNFPQTTPYALPKFGHFYFLNNFDEDWRAFFCFHRPRFEVWSLHRQTIVHITTPHSALARATWHAATSLREDRNKAMLQLTSMRHKLRVRLSRSRAFIHSRPFCNCVVTRDHVLMTHAPAFGAHVCQRSRPRTSSKRASAISISIRAPLAWLLGLVNNSVIAQHAAPLRWRIRSTINFARSLIKIMASE